MLGSKGSSFLYQLGSAFRMSLHLHRCVVFAFQEKEHWEEKEAEYLHKIDEITNNHVKCMDQEKVCCVIQNVLSAMEGGSEDRFPETQTSFSRQARLLAVFQERREKLDETLNDTQEVLAASQKELHSLKMQLDTTTREKVAEHTS